MSVYTESIQKVFQSPPTCTITIKTFESLRFLTEINLDLLQRFGSALVPWGSLQIKQKQYAKDVLPIDPACECPTCQRWEFLQFSPSPTVSVSFSELHSDSFSFGSSFHTLNPSSSDVLEPLNIPIHTDLNQCVWKDLLLLHSSADGIFYNFYFLLL